MSPLSGPSTAALIEAAVVMTVALPLVKAEVMRQLSCISGREQAYTKLMFVRVVLLQYTPLPPSPSERRDFKRMPFTQRPEWPFGVVFVIGSIRTGHGKHSVAPSSEVKVSGGHPGQLV